MPPSEILYENPPAAFLDRGVHFLVRHWLLWVNLFIGLYAFLPWLSPLLRVLGWQRLGEAIFLIYRPLCHQKPELSYSLGGYQVAYCHRDTAIYTALFLGGLVFGLFRRRLRPLPLWAFLLSVVPMAVDGITQAPRAIFPDWPLRAGNGWAVALTGGVFPAWFYSGDGIGSLNWGLRTVTGILFGLGLAFTVYPHIEKETRRTLGNPGRPGTTSGPGRVAFS